VCELQGSGKLEAVAVENNATGERATLQARSMFIFIGAAPHTDWLGGLVELDEGGYVRTGRDVAVAGNVAATAREPLLLESSQPGVFAVGDVRSGSVKRVATAVGEGSMAVRLVHEHLAGRGRAGGARRRAQVATANA
jgi:thioredoxin reductase (NADPH)